jgi:hypothetical protein
MPVLECSCGMVMSVSIAKPRNMCIRCGGVEFQELEKLKLGAKATYSAKAPAAIKVDCFPLASSAMAGPAPGSIVAICSL